MPIVTSLIAHDEPAFTRRRGIGQQRFGRRNRIGRIAGQRCAAGVVEQLAFREAGQKGTRRGTAMQWLALADMQGEEADAVARADPVET